MYIDWNVTFIFFLYTIIGAIFGFCLVYMIAGIRLTLNNRSRMKKAESAYVPGKTRCRIEGRAENLKNRDVLFNNFIRENMELMVNRQDYQIAAKHALYMKDSALVRHEKES